MKKKFLYIGLSSLFLLSCTKKVEKIDLNELDKNIQNKNDFIVVLSSDSCGHCQNLKKTYKESLYDFNYYEIDFDDIKKGIAKNNEESILMYKYLSETADYCFTNVESYLLEETYGSYFGNDDSIISYAEYNGKDKYINGFSNLVTPISFFYVDGEIVNFEFGDYSKYLDKVMNKYRIAIKNKENNTTNSSTNSNYFNPYLYIHDLNFNEIENKIEEKEDFILILSSKNCSHCNKQFDDIYDKLHLKPQDINFYYVDELLVNLEVNLNGEPLNGVEAYEQAKKEYRYFASYLEKIGDYVLDEEGGYLRNNYTERFGEKEPALIYPVTLIFIDGEVNIELSYLGYGWSEEDETFTSFINLFNNIKNL